MPAVQRLRPPMHLHRAGDVGGWLHFYCGGLPPCRGLLWLSSPLHVLVGLPAEPSAFMLLWCGMGPGWSQFQT